METMVKNRVFRSITLCLQIIAIVMYFGVPLILGNGISLIWLILGVIHTVMFAVVFFRNARTRTALSVIFMILVILWCLVLLTAILLLALPLEIALYGPMTLLAPFMIYFLTSLIAIIFALASPRRFAV